MVRNPTSNNKVSLKKKFYLIYLCFLKYFSDISFITIIRMHEKFISLIMNIDYSFAENLNKRNGNL